MFYVYSDNREVGNAIPLSVLMKIDANKKYAEHYYNHCYLQFILKHEASTFIEKAQANKEIGICDRKLNYWKRHQNWDATESAKLCSKIRKQWHGKK